MRWCMPHYSRSHELELLFQGSSEALHDLNFRVELKSKVLVRIALPPHRYGHIIRYVEEVHDFLNFLFHDILLDP